MNYCYSVFATRGREILVDSDDDMDYESAKALFDSVCEEYKGDPSANVGIDRRQEDGEFEDIVEEN